LELIKVNWVCQTTLLHLNSIKDFVQERFSNILASCQFHPIWEKYLWMLKKDESEDIFFSTKVISFFLSFISEGFFRPTNVSTKIWSLKRRSINLEMSYLLTGEKDRFGKYKKSRLKTFLRNWNNFYYKKHCQFIKKLRNEKTEKGHLLEIHLLKKSARHQNLDCLTLFEQTTKIY
jgi:hypothetical protein